MADNLLSLGEWQDAISYNPWHFWGLSGSKVPITSACNSIVSEYAWQKADQSGRAEIANAIATAEERLMPHLGYSPAPHYREVTLPWPRFPAQNINRYGYVGADNRFEAIRLPEGKILGVGVEKYTLIGTGAVTLTDLDGDGIKETFTVTVPTTETDENKIEAYFSAIDRYDTSDVSNRWKIAPVRVKITGGNVIITGKSYLIVEPLLYQGVTANTGLDPVTAGNYASTLDVYKHSLDPTGITLADCQAVLIWESSPYPYYATVGTDPAGEAYALARVGIRDAEQGIVSVGESIWDATTSQFVSLPWFSSTNRWTPPSRIKIRYQAGVPRLNGKMDARMSGIVTRLSAAELPNKICACDEANRTIYHWQYDLSRSGGANDESYQSVSPEDLRNPLGTRRGQVYAWKDIQSSRILTGFSI